MSHSFDPPPPSAHPTLTVQAPELHAPVRHLAIEGPIGVGKTSLALKLASRWSMRALLEQPGDNPFLEPFYEVGARYALPAQLSFLLQRVAQSREIALAVDAVPAHTASLVTDFMLEKDALFARLTLPDDEFALYGELAAQLPFASVTPDLVVYLQASPEALFARIQKRAIAAEQLLTDHYLRTLCAAYDGFFYHYSKAPVLTVNTEHFNPLDSEADMALLIERLTTLRGRKTSFVKGMP
jgi:deoxyadenosine/deoxycytidine kinase